MECLKNITYDFIHDNNPEANSYLLYMSKSISCLEKIGERICVPQNHVFIEQGKYPKYCYIVKSGKVVAYETFKNGEERLYHIHERNSLFLESNLLFDKPTPVGFRTIEATEVIRINKNSLLYKAKTNPEFAYALFESASNKFFSAMQQVCEVKKYSILWKMCGLFLDLADYYGIFCGSKIWIQERFSQQMIANLLGINRITAVRAIKELKDRGYLEQKKGYYYLTNRNALKEFQTSLEKE